MPPRVIRKKKGERAGSTQPKELESITASPQYYGGIDTNKSYVQKMVASEKKKAKKFN